MPKQTKRQSKVKGLLSWFKSNSPAKGALLFALTFVVIGGSYMAYKSFAEAVWFAATPPELIKCVGNCEQVYDNHVKYPTNAARINSNGSYVYYRFYLGHPWTDFPSYTSIPTKFCAKIRATNKTSGADASIQWSLESGNLGNTTTAFIPGINSYDKYCTPYVNIPGGNNFSNMIVKKVGGTADVYIANMTVETP